MQPAKALIYLKPSLHSILAPSFLFSLAHYCRQKTARATLDHTRCNPQNPKRTHAIYTSPPTPPSLSHPLLGQIHAAKIVELILENVVAERAGAREKLVDQKFPSEPFFATLIIHDPQFVVERVSLKGGFNSH